MGERRNPRAKWVLPEIVNPEGRLCYKVFVPNERQHIGAFLGAMYTLTSAMSWQDDIAHTAKDVALVWQTIFDDMRKENCNEPEVQHAIAEMEYTMSICEQLRFQNGKLQGYCCGEWVDIDGQGDSKLGGPGQPGGGATQPKPGGAPVCYHGNSAASAQWLAPTAVNSGDVLTFSHFDGSAWDGNAPFPLPGRWDCPTGEFFFLGVCQKGTELDVLTDPMPTAPHMSLIAQIAGVWYSCLTPITIPGGVSNAQIVVQLNDDTIVDNQGQYAFDCCIQNNQVLPTSHKFDFTKGPQGWTVFTDTSITVAHGEWTAALGWKSTTGLTSSTVHRTAVYIQAPAVGSVATKRVTIEYSFTAGQNSGGGNLVLELQDGSSGLDGVSGLADDTAAELAFIGPYTVNPAVLYLTCANHNGSDPSPTGECIITAVTFEFDGADPYAAY